MMSMNQKVMIGARELNDRQPQQDLQMAAHYNDKTNLQDEQVIVDGLRRNEGQLKLLCLRLCEE
jgi:hypothetical protein